MEGPYIEMTIDQLVELLSQVCTALQFCLCDHVFCDKFIEIDDGLNFVKGLMTKYFLEGDKLQIANLVQSRNISELQKRVLCLVDMMYVAGNLIIHVARNREEVKSLELIQGLDYTIMNILRTFTYYQDQVGQEILDGKFWSTVVWSIRVCCEKLPRRQVINDYKMVQKQNQTVERQEEIEN